MQKLVYNNHIGTKDFYLNFYLFLRKFALKMKFFSKNLSNKIIVLKFLFILAFHLFWQILKLFYYYFIIKFIIQTITDNP